MKKKVTITTFDKTECPEKNSLRKLEQLIEYYVSKYL